MTASESSVGPESTEAVWEARYRAGERLFSGDANDALVHEITGLPPGTALDLGCGEGGDAVWLARQGWRVTAADVSATALERAAGLARAAGVADRIDWQRHDLARSFPAGTFDLVSSHFLYPPRLEDRDDLLREAARAVAPGGLLLIVSHAGFPPWEPAPEPAIHFPDPAEMLTALGLRDGPWDVLVAESYERAVTDPEGRPATRRDSTLKLRRHRAG